MKWPRTSRREWQLTETPPGSELLSHVHADAIHIWYTRFPAAAWLVPTLWTLLSKSEREMATAYLLASHQQASVVRRGLLRVLLGHYLDISAGMLEIGTDPLGKPLLRPIEGQPLLSFNISQSGDLVSYAISRDPVGIDVEEFDTTHDLSALASLFFTDVECDWLASLPEEQQRASALRIWVCKEAYAKATGEGVSDSLSSLSVVHNGRLDGAIGFASNPPTYQASSQWMLQEIHSIPDCAAAVVYPIHDANHRTICIRALRCTNLALTSL